MSQIVFSELIQSADVKFSHAFQWYFDVLK